jgi:hypothetical protein
MSTREKGAQAGHRAATVADPYRIDINRTGRWFMAVLSAGIGRESSFEDCHPEAYSPKDLDEGYGSE